MSTKLSVIDSSALDAQDRRELTESIDAIIASHKGNRQEINRLVFESVSAMTMGENYEQELSSKKGLRRFFGGITGSNKRLQDKINSNRSVAQYAAQQTIQRLAEQNLLTFDLITAVNNKLNASLVAVEGEINQIYAVLTTFFKQSRSDLIQLETRVDRLERNVNLLNWNNTIEYQMYRGIEYADLSEIEKIVCLVCDFYAITHGNWSTSDLLLLKSTMDEIGLSPKAKITYQQFIRYIGHNPELQLHLFGETFETSVIEPSYAPIMAGIQKGNRLAGEEHYIIESVQQLLGTHCVMQEEHELASTLTEYYLASESGIGVHTEVNLYDLMLELLFNHGQLERLDPVYDNTGEEYMEKKETVKSKEAVKSKEIMAIEESFDELLKKAIKTIYVGDRVTGVVTEISPTKIYVDLSGRYAGYIPISELSDDPTVKAMDIVKVGDKIETYVLSINRAECTVMLSKKRLDTLDFTLL